jgi:hypothetical protein
VDSDQQLVERLIGRFPELQEIYDIHVDNNGGLLPYVFFWDVLQEVVQCYLGRESDLRDWCSLLEFLEEEYGRGELPAQELIVTAFLDSLPYPGEPAHGIADRLGPRLAEKYRQLRP